jgi:SAM-dependent methyltransferase/uncharacterized protein YbaR (Trm112 family)
MRPCHDLPPVIRPTYQLSVDGHTPPLSSYEMYTRLLPLLRCPNCRGQLELLRLVSDVTASGEDVSEGLLHCATNHCFPIVRGVPRMLQDALDEHWPVLRSNLPNPAPSFIRSLIQAHRQTRHRLNHDRPTRDSFSKEWDYFDLTGRTWSMELEDRVKWFFLDAIQMSTQDLAGKTMLDAGCGNGTQSVAYTKLGLEVLAVDLSSGLEHGHAFRSMYQGADPTKVHFIQADLQSPPLAPASLDLIHSAGVLHHTPDTRKTFQTLCSLLRPGSTFYVWLYKYERSVTPVVNSIRHLTTRIPTAVFEKIARLMALPFIGFCVICNELGIRQYSPLNRPEAALALMDIFGAPYAHYHSLDEVADWYRAEGFKEIWSCNNGRRGFGVCGRLPSVIEETR